MRVSDFDYEQGNLIYGGNDKDIVGCNFAILGKPISSTNSQVVFTNRHTKHAQVSKSVAYKRYQQDFLRQVPLECRNLALGSPRKPIRATISVYYRDGRGDLETKGLYDLCQKAGVIKNDLYLIEHHEYRHVDKNNPRVEFCFEEI